MKYLFCDCDPHLVLIVNDLTGLGDEATLSKITSSEKGRDVLCASTGSCSKRSQKLTMLRISYPSKGKNGKIEVIESLPQQDGNQTQGKLETIPESKADTISVESL